MTFIIDGEQIEGDNDNICVKSKYGKFIGTFDEYDTVNIECFRNEPSGILTTKSDYYIITNGKNILFGTYVLCTNKLFSPPKINYKFFINNLTPKNKLQIYNIINRVK